MNKTLTAKCHFLYVKKGLLNAYVSFSFPWVVRFNKKDKVFLASFLIKFDDVNLKFDVSRYDYPMRIQSRFSQELLQLFTLYLH